MTITIQSPEKRIAQLEELLRDIMDVHVLTSTTSQSGRRFYYLSTGGCDVTITARQHNLLKALLGEDISDEAFADEVVEYLREPIED